MFTVKQPRAHVTLLIAVLISISKVDTLSDQTIDDMLLDLSISEDQLTNNLNDRYKGLFEVDLLSKVKPESFIIKFLDTQEAQDKAAVNQITIDELKKIISTKVSEERKKNSNLDDSFFKHIDSVVHKFLIQELIIHDRPFNVQSLAVFVNQSTNTKTVTQNTDDSKKLADIGGWLNDFTYNLINDLNNNIKSSFPAAIEGEIDDMLLSLEEETNNQEDKYKGNLSELEKNKLENELLSPLKSKIVKLFNYLTDFDHKHHISHDEKGLDMIISSFILASIKSGNEIYKRFGLDIVQSIHLILKEKSYNKSEGTNWLYNMIFNLLFTDDSGEIINFDEKFTNFILARKEHNGKIDLKHLESGDKRTRDLTLVHVYFYFKEMMHSYLKLKDGTFGNVNLFTEADSEILSNNLNTVIEGRKYIRINSYSDQIHNFMTAVSSEGMDYKINDIAYHTVVNLIVDKYDTLNKDNFFDVADEYIEEIYKKNEITMYSQTDYSIEDIYGMLKTILQLSQKDNLVKLNFKSIPDTTKFFTFVFKHDSHLKHFYEVYFSNMLEDGEINPNNKLGATINIKNAELLKYLQNMTFIRKLISVSADDDDNHANTHSSQLINNSSDSLRKGLRVLVAL